MSIVTSQLISAAVLQLPFVNKEGLPLTNGIVTFYKSDMVTLKNIYYQATPGVYIAAPNPMTLSGAGTPVDVNGNDIILFYYPYSETDSNVFEPYFVTAYDQFGTLQFTRFNFPFVGEPNAAATIATLENYVLNNRFWRNIGSLSAGTLGNSWSTQYNSSGSVYYATVAPDQHDGFSMPDFNYIKNVNGSCTETITFNTFSETTTPILTGDVGPEYYLNHNCTADTSGSTLKVYQFPISFHLATLVGEEFSITIQGQSLNGGVPNSTVSFYIYQFCGTGATSPVPKFVGSKTFTNSWTKYTITGATFAATTGLVLSAADDDAYYLQIAMPTGSANGICDINFTLPSIYLSATLSDLPTNSFSTYDQIDSIINTPRTGDVRTSLNQFFSYGWVPLNNGTIGNANSNATSRHNQDTWPLFNLIWTMFSTYNNSDVNVLAQMYTSSVTPTPVGYGTSAILDFNAGNQISLTKTMGKVILGTVPSFNETSNSNFGTALLPSYYQTVGGSDVGGNLLMTASTPLGFFNGMPIVFQQDGTLPTGLNTTHVFYVANFNGSTTFNVSTSFANAIASPAVVIAWTDNGTPVNNVAAAYPGSFEGEYAHTQALSEMINHEHDPLAPMSTFIGQGSGTSLLGNLAGSGAQGSTGLVTGYPGTGQTAFNITQPGVFFNMYMKL